MKMFTCWCGFRMPETSVRAIAAHQEEHPTEAQLRERADRRALEIAVEAMEGRRKLDVSQRMAAIDAMLSASPEMIFEELFQKPIRKALADVDGESAARPDGKEKR